MGFDELHNVLSRRDAADELMKPMKGKELPSVVLVRKVKASSS